MKSMINDMKESLIYGLKTCLEYFVIIAAILILSIVIDLIGGRDIDHYFSTPYFYYCEHRLGTHFYLRRPLSVGSKNVDQLIQRRVSRLDTEICN